MPRQREWIRYRCFPGMSVFLSDRTPSGSQREGKQSEAATRGVPGDPRGHRLRSRPIDRSRWRRRSKDFLSVHFESLIVTNRVSKIYISLPKNSPMIRSIREWSLPQRRSQSSLRRCQGFLVPRAPAHYVFVRTHLERSLTV